MIDRSVVELLEAMPGLVAPIEGRRLAELAAGVPAHQAIVEIGAHRGLSSCWLAAGSKAGHGARLTSIDPWPAAGAPEEHYSAEPWGEVGALETWRRNIASVGADELATPLRSLAVDVAAAWSEPVGLLFHDAEHTFEAVAADFLAWLPFLVDGAWVAVHDYYGNVPDGQGGWRRAVMHQYAVEKVILPSGRWTDVEIIGSPTGATLPNLWLGRRWAP